MIVKTIDIIDEIGTLNGKIVLTPIPIKGAGFECRIIFSINASEHISILTSVERAKFFINFTNFEIMKNNYWTQKQEGATLTKKQALELLGG